MVLSRLSLSILAWISLGIYGTAALRLYNDSRADRTDGVTLMINVIEENIDLIDIKITHLVKNTNYWFASRIVVLDTGGAEPSDALKAAVQDLIDRGTVDAYRVVDYSDAYWERVLRWLSPKATRKIGHSGNLVYFYMMDTCPTNYLVHYDLDMVIYSSPGYSWVREGVQLLSQDPHVFYLTSPRHGSTGSPSKRYTCENTGNQATWVAMRNFLMDVRKAFEAMDTVDLGFQGSKLFCGGDKRTVENFLSCTICEMRNKGVEGFERLDIMDGSKSYALHFPELARCGPEVAAWVIEHMVDRNLSISSGPGFQAECLLHWLLTSDKMAKRGVFGWNSVPSRCKEEDELLQGLRSEEASLQSLRQPCRRPYGFNRWG